jgi:hypothetical protein
MYHLFDTIELDDGAKVRLTGDGYLVATPCVARTGIQLYSGREVGKPDMKVVRVFRSEAEVFNGDSMHSYAHKPFTNDHPPEPVTADNWKDYSAGQLGEDVVRDGEFVRVPMVMMDSAAIQDYRAGKRELSLGYTCDLQWAPGTAPNGEQYDAVQTNIRANHLALVKTARGGPSLRVGDDNNPRQENDSMNTQQTGGATAIVMCDGVNLSLDATSAAVINAYIKRQETALEGLKDKLGTAEQKNAKDATDHATALTEKQTQLDASNAKVVTLEKQIKDGEMTPQKVDALVVERAGVIGGAKKVLGDKLVIENKTNADIRRQVVDTHMKDAAKGWSDDAVTASFNTIVASVKDNSTNTNNGGGGQRPGGGGAGGTSFEDLRQGFRFDAQPEATNADKAYGDMATDLSNAWKGSKAAA